MATLSDMDVMLTAPFSSDRVSATVGHVTGVTDTLSLRSNKQRTPRRRSILTATVALVNYVPDEVVS